MWSPASRRWTVRHWKRATAPSRRSAGDAGGGGGTAEFVVGRGGELAGEVVLVGGQYVDGEVRGVGEVREARAVLPGHHRTRGGFNETEVKEFAVMPTLRPSGARAVTTVTPVAY